MTFIIFAVYLEIHMKLKVQLKNKKKYIKNNNSTALQIMFLINAKRYSV